MAKTSRPIESGAPNLPRATETFKFPLSRTEPQIVTPGGAVTECTVKNFPALAGSDAAVFLLTLEPGGLREPHWHPNAWELEYVVEGRARLGVVTPQGRWESVDLEPGDVGFVPRGWGHFIRNVGETVMKMPIVFGNDDPDDVGLSTFFSGVPTDTFTQTLGLPDDGLDAADKPGKTLFIVGPE
jgi:oxalate decarboxylase